MTELDAARYIERAGALALVLGVAVAMLAQPTFAHAGRCQRAAFPRGGVGLLPPIPAEMRTAPTRKPRAMPAADPIPASGGWAGVISAILVAFRRRPPANAGVGSESDLSLMGRLRGRLILGRRLISRGLRRSLVGRRLIRRWIRLLGQRWRHQHQGSSQCAHYFRIHGVIPANEAQSPSEPMTECLLLRQRRRGTPGTEALASSRPARRG